MDHPTENQTTQNFRWAVQSGNLLTSVDAASASEAILAAIRRESPDELGEIISVREEGQHSIFARLFHTESFLKAHNLLAQSPSEFLTASS